MDDEVSERVFSFVAAERGEKRQKLSVTTTLSEDLGIEGDDAVEFFERFQTKFSVDLRVLGAEWHYYFAPAGFPIGAALVFAIPSTIISILFTRWLPHIPDWLCFLTGLVLWFLFLLGWGRLQKAHEPQITVQDLIDCARGGIWTKQVTEILRAKLASRRRYGRTGRWFV